MIKKKPYCFFYPFEIIVNWIVCELLQACKIAKYGEDIVYCSVNLIMLVNLGQKFTLIGGEFSFSKFCDMIIV